MCTKRYLENISTMMRSGTNSMHDDANLDLSGHGVLK